MCIYIGMYIYIYIYIDIVIFHEIPCKIPRSSAEAVFVPTKARLVYPKVDMLKEVQRRRSIGPPTGGMRSAGMTGWVVERVIWVDLG